MNKEQILASAYRSQEEIDMHFDEIYIIPTDDVHESGFQYIAIIGVVRKVNTETTLGDGLSYYLCGTCDDISTIFPVIDLGDNLKLPAVRMDCLTPDKILRYHSRLGYFTVDEPMSSMEITFHLNKKETNETQM